MALAKRVEELKIARFTYLEHLYEVAEGSTRTHVNRWELGESLGLDQKTCELVTDYLHSESLLDYETLDGGISITHYGVIEVEQALTNPSESTEHFLPVNYVANFISVEQMVNSQILQGSPNSAQSNVVEWKQTGELKALVGAIAESVEKLQLPVEKQHELQAELNTIKSQLQASRPKKSIMTECLHSIRSILEGAAGSILAGQLLVQVTHLLK